MLWVMGFVSLQEKALKQGIWRVPDSLALASLAGGTQ